MKTGHRRIFAIAIVLGVCVFSGDTLAQREYAATELWIVPRGAAVPIPTPTVNRNEVVHCPEISVNGLRYVPKPVWPLTFTARVQSRDPNIKPSLLWETSAGTIAICEETEKAHLDHFAIELQTKGKPFQGCSFVYQSGSQGSRCALNPGLKLANAFGGITINQGSD